MAIDSLRFHDTFNRELFLEFGYSITVIGDGALGSNLLELLGSWGIDDRMTVYDDDVVARHNLSNQAFDEGDIGWPKVEATRQRLLRHFGVRIKARKERYSGQHPLQGVVFCCPDSMATRRTVFEQGCMFNPHVPLLLEARMGTDNGALYVIDPCNPHHVSGYLDPDVLFADHERIDVLAPACQTRQSIRPTAMALASYAAWQMVAWFDIIRGIPGSLDNEYVFDFRSPCVMSRRFAVNL